MMIIWKQWIQGLKYRLFRIAHIHTTSKKNIKNTINNSLLNSKIKHIIYNIGTYILPSDQEGYQKCLMFIDNNVKKLLAANIINNQFIWKHPNQ